MHGVQEPNELILLHLSIFCISTLIYKDHDTTGTGGPSMREAGVEERKKRRILSTSILIVSVLGNGVQRREYDTTSLKESTVFVLWCSSLVYSTCACFDSGGTAR